MNIELNELNGIIAIEGLTTFKKNHLLLMDVIETNEYLILDTLGNPLNSICKIDGYKAYPTQNGSFLAFASQGSVFVFEQFKTARWVDEDYDGQPIEDTPAEAIHYKLIFRPINVYNSALKQWTMGEFKIKRLENAINNFIYNLSI